MPRNNMPPDWRPPAPAWESRWEDSGDPLVTGCFGIQGDSPSLLDAWVASAFTGTHAPLAFDQGAFVDAKGVANHLYIAYWRRSAYESWWRLDGASGWWGDQRRLMEDVGYWRELFTMPFDRFETLHSTTDPHGVGVSANGMEGPIEEHGYAGAMRDRIPCSDGDDLRGVADMHEALSAERSDGGRRVLVRPPANMCVIRSGQNWSCCDEEQKTWYLEQLHPVLLEGMRYLRDNPIESNCYSLRFVDQKDAAWGATEQSFGLGYGMDVHAFEDWAKSHPTHLAIFEGFLNMAAAFGENLQLRLWHEVTALPWHGCEFEYIDCHSETGLLRWAT